MISITTIFSVSLILSILFALVPLKALLGLFPAKVRDGNLPLVMGIIILRIFWCSSSVIGLATALLLRAPFWTHIAP